MHHLLSEQSYGQMYEVKSLIQVGLPIPVDTILIVVMAALLLFWVAVELKFEGMIRDGVRIFSAFALCLLFMAFVTTSGMIVW